jgi:hypothetical protein
MKIVCLTLMLGCLSAASASAGNAEEMLRQHLLFCSHSMIEEQGTVVVPPWVTGKLGVTRGAGDCAIASIKP